MWLQSCVCEAQDEEKSKTEIVGRAHIPPTFLPVDNEQTVKQPRVGVRCADRASAELFFTVVAFPPAFFLLFLLLSWLLLLLSSFAMPVYRSQSGSLRLHLSPSLLGCDAREW